MSDANLRDAKPRQVKIAEPSIQSVFIVPIANNLPLATGTGFVVQHISQPYLVTNYHVAAARNPRDGQPMHSSGAVPDTLRITYMMQPKPDRIEWEPRDEVVLETDPDRAHWLQHPVHGRKVDVVAVPLSNIQGADLHPYEIGGTAPELVTGPSEDVSIIGFPFGFTAGGAFGVWTHGFTASEPDVDWNELPCFLVDARTREGQSGSPVIAYSSGSGGHRLSGGALAFSPGPVTNLLGVYSGRLNRDSDIGVVWKVDVVRDILAAQEQGIPGL